MGASIVGVLALGLSGSARAAGFFVSTTGDDGASGAIASPWRSVAPSIARLAPGDTLYLRTGQYFESVAAAVSGAPGAPIVIRSYPGERALLDSGYPEFQTPGNDAWDLIDATLGEYRSRGTYSGDQLHGYVIPDGPYENERVALVPYDTTSHFRATTDQYNPVAFYVGPGTFVHPDGRIGIRLAKTGDLIAAEARYGPILVGDPPDPRGHSIVLSQASSTLRVTGSYLVFLELELNPAEETISLGANAHDLRFDGVTAWMGGGTLDATEPGIHHVTVTRCRFYGDAPYWVFYSDMKDAPAPADRLRGTSIRLAAGTHDWEISHSHVRGSAQDLIGTTDAEYNIAIHHNRLENALDDLIELEGALGRVEVFENLMLNGLTALAPGQSSPFFAGPLLVYRNVIGLLRTPPVNRQAGINSWNGGGRYGFEYLFKQGSSSDGTRNAHYYHNTMVLLGSAGEGINLTPRFPQDTRIANNLLVTVNGPVNGEYLTGPGQVVNGNLYWKVNTVDQTPLAGLHDDLASLTAATGLEAQGLGAIPKRGTDPGFAGFVLGVIDPSSAVWAIGPGSEKLFHAEVLLGAASPALAAGIAIPPHPTLGTLPDSRASNDIGALPSGTPASEFDVFPFNAVAEAPAGPPVNRAPLVYAGADRAITLPADAPLDGSVSDDGLPAPPALAYAWSQIAGPTAAAITSPGALDTRVAFTVAGTYRFQLLVSDGALSAADSTTVVVGSSGPPPPASFTLDARIAAGADDAEEKASGSVDLVSSDLELVTDGTLQVVGLRFLGLAIPSGATITSAWIQLKADEAHSGATTLSIRAQAIDQAPAFAATARNLSTRARTLAFAAWSPPAWVVGSAGATQRTPDLAAVVQEVVSRPGWASGNALAFLIGGSGNRTAEAVEGDAAGAPLLHVEFATSGGGPINRAPFASAAADQAVTLPADAPLDGAASDDGLPAPPALTYAWSQIAGPAATITNASALDTRVAFSVAGTYDFRLAVSDGALSSADSVRIVVSPPGPPPPTTTTLDVRLAAGADDAEERVNGAVDLASGDLELITDGTPQVVGLRFLGLAIPRGAVISAAWIQFRADEAQTVATALTIRAQAIDQAPAFTTAARNLSARTRTAAFASWAPAAWAAGAASAAQRTPDLSAVIQEVVNRPGWAGGNALAVLIDGAGHRTAESVEGLATGAPLLHVEFGGGGGEPVNGPPIVDAGPNQAITLPADAPLDGTVSDDGLPAPPALTYAWSQIAGPATAAITTAGALDTRVAFTVAGTYRFRLLVSDGALSAADSTTIVAGNSGPPPPASSTLDARIAAGADDAEEKTGGSVDLASSDLELITDGAAQVVGLRFQALAIPRGAVVTAAWIQFKADEAQSVATALTIRAQAIDQAPAFTTAARNLSTRTRTAAFASWAPAAWVVGAAAAAQRTPDLSAVIQEVVGRPGWASGNALAILIDGSGHRTAEAVEGDAPGAPLLHVEFATGSAAQAASETGGEPAPRSLVLEAPVTGLVAPNPVRHGSTTIAFLTRRAGRARLDVFDPLGRRVRTLLPDGFLPAGSQSVRFDIRDDSGARLSSGIYFYRLVTVEGAASGRILILD